MIEIIEQLSALETLLRFCNLNYKPDNEDGEFIVRLLQIIAAGLYKGKIVEILEPQAEYWNEVISPSAEECINQHKDLSFEDFYYQANVANTTGESDLIDFHP